MDMIKVLERFRCSIGKFEKFYHVVDSNTSALPPYNPEYQSDGKKVYITNNYYNNLGGTLSHVPYMQPIQQVVINAPSDNGTTDNDTKKNKDDKKKDDKEDNDTLRKVVSMIGTVGLAFTTTYMMTKDEFIIHWLSDADQTKQNIYVNIYVNIPLYTEIKQICLYYDDWVSEFRKRSSKVLTGKVGVFGCGLLTMAGIGWGNESFAMRSILGAAVSGCYLMWKHLTTDKMLEEKSYRQLTTAVDDLMAKLKNMSNENMSLVSYPDLY